MSTTDTKIRLSGAAKTEFEVMDALDEGQITEELKGHVIEEYFYEFQMGGKNIVGISWSGVKHVARKMAEKGQPISIDKVDIEDTPEEFIASAKATNLKTGFSMIGMAACSKIMTLKTGERKPNAFARTIAHSKAQRNAIRNFIPETAIKEGYKAWKQRGSIEKVFGDRITGEKK